jgi:hypothetical protein
LEKTIPGKDAGGSYEIGFYGLSHFRKLLISDKPHILIEDEGCEEKFFQKYPDKW